MKTQTIKIALMNFYESKGWMLMYHNTKELDPIKDQEEIRNLKELNTMIDENERQ